MLTVGSLRRVLVPIFPVQRVRSAIAALKDIGVIARGSSGPTGSPEVSAHSAALMLMTVAVDVEGDAPRALDLALRMRSWCAIAPEPGRRFVAGYRAEAVSDARLANVMVAQLATGRATGGAFHPGSAIGNGLLFGRHGDVVIQRQAPDYTSLGEEVISELAAWHEAPGPQREFATLLLNRLERAVRPEKQLQEAAE